MSHEKYIKFLKNRTATLLMEYVHMSMTLITVNVKRKRKRRYSETSSVHLEIPKNLKIHKLNLPV